MARDINDIYNLVRYVVRKERGQFITVAQAMQNLYAGMLEVYEDYFKMYGIDQVVHDAINPFKVNYTFTSDAGGTVTLPTDYLHLLPNVFTVSGSTINKVRFVNEDEWIDAITSQLRPVTLTKPIAKDYGNGFNLYPETLQVGQLTYMRIPAYPVLSYTQVGRDITYDPLTSVQIEFSDVYIDKIIAKALGYTGINMSEPEIVQFGQVKDQTT